MTIRFILVLLLFAVPVNCYAIPTNIVKPVLVSDHEATDGKSPFRIGVYFKIKPDWHIYWKYPGDSGLPTKISFELPKGFQVGDLNFPVPEIWEQAPGLLGYGYAKEVLLSASVLPPSGFDPKQRSLPIKAKVSWLSCGIGLCVPENKELSLEIPVGSSRPPKGKALFSSWDKKLPVPYDSPDVLFSAKIEGKQGEEKTVTTFKIVLTWQEAVTDVSWIPNLPRKVKIKDIKLVSGEGKTVLTFGLINRNSDSVEGLETLVIYNTEKGENAVSFPIDIKK